jgi:hypothetical protein
MTDEQKVAGERFLEELAKYILWRLEENDIEDHGFDTDQYVARYGEFLEALGVDRYNPLFEALRKHMEEMKDAPPPPRSGLGPC